MTAVTADVYNHTIFTRLRTDGTTLTCKMINGVVRFFIDDKEVNRKSLADLDPIEKVINFCRNAKDKATLERFKQAGITYMWNMQMPLFPNEVELYNQAVNAVHQAKQAELEKARQERAKTNYGEITLSTRGWGDYPSLIWVGDLNRPDNEILAECKTLFEQGHDVDLKLTDDEILALIAKARVSKQEFAEQRAKDIANAQSIIDKASPTTIKAYEQCKGDPERIEGEPLYYAVRAYADAIEFLAIVENGLD